METLGWMPGSVVDAAPRPAVASAVGTSAHEARKPPGRILASLAGHAVVPAGSACAPAWASVAEAAVLHAAAGPESAHCCRPLGSARSATPAEGVDPMLLQSP